MKQRDIKFRVWDNVDYMSEPFTLQGLVMGEIKFTPECKVMQFTGLKDKNGVDVYEGDLVKNVGTPKLKTVVYHDQAFYLREGNAHTRLSKLNFYGEIIGNIHEHKHLLK